MTNQTDNENQPQGHWGRWVGPVVLIVIGIIFLLQNIGVQLPGNWWAVFFLIPAVYSFAGAWKSYRASGGDLTMAALGPLIGGVVLLVLALVFLFDLSLNWGVVLPLILIAVGVAALLRSRWRV
jgi:LiaF transmembrane domain